jgi:hypothetical protein
MSSTYGDSSNDAAKRLHWALTGGWKVDPVKQYASLGAFLVSGDSFGYGTDIDTLGTYKARQHIDSLYNRYVRSEIGVLIAHYASVKYPSTTNVVDQYKKDVLVGFFDSNVSGAGSQPISQALVINFNANKSGDWIDEEEISRILSVINAAQGTARDTAITAESPAIEAIINKYGFNEWISKQDPAFSVVDDVQNLTAFNNITTLNQEQMATLKDAVRRIRGLPPAGELTRSEEININQCALMSDLLHKGDSYTKYPQRWNFSDRIYPVTLDNFNPDALINMCTIPKTVKSFLNKETEINGVYWDLYWVYLDAGGIKEESIFRTNKGKEEGTPFVDMLGTLKKQKFLNQSVSNITSLIDSEKKGYTIKNIDIVYEGTNPSTARNDVKVTVKINLDSLLALKSPCCYVALKTKGVDTNRDG